MEFATDINNVMYAYIDRKKKFPVTTLLRSIGYETDWDGTYNGKSLPVATYYYIINPKNGRNVISGSVTIIK